MGIYNEKNKNHVIQAIDSILQQSFTDFEFIICDDGSTNEFMHGCRMCVGRIPAFGYCVMIKHGIILYIESLYEACQRKILCKDGCG